MFGELEPLGLIVGADPIAVKRAGLLQHLLVDQASDDLPMFEDERHFARAPRPPAPA